MMTTQHTPGPWLFDMGEDGATEIYNVDFSRFIAESHSTYNRDEAVANACLISAAPELLAALERILSYDDMVEGADEARAAIAKARGDDA